MFNTHLDYEVERYIESGLRPEYQEGLSIEDAALSQTDQNYGGSIENAISINIPNALFRTSAECEYIESICGEEDKCWKFQSQDSFMIENRFYDEIIIKMNDGKETKFYFVLRDFWTPQTMHKTIVFWYYDFGYDSGSR